MEWLVRLLVPVALAHPGHGPEAPMCEEDPAPICALPPAETHGDSELQLARVLLDRGQAAEAALRVAERAAVHPEAARILGEALEALGDTEGARLARERASKLTAARR